MKRLLFVAALFAVSTFTVKAQSKSATQQVKTNEVKTNFSNISEKFMELAKQNKVQDARAKFGELAGIMQQSIQANREKSLKLSGDEKDRIESIIVQQNTLYSEIKMLTVDVAKNYNAINEKLLVFLNTL